MACVYVLEFPSGKKYVGITVKDAGERFKEHVRAANRGSNYLVHRSILKYGHESVSVSSLFEGSQDECKKKEVELISSLGTKAPGGYNLTDGGDGFSGLTKDVIARRAETMRVTMSDPAVRAAKLEQLSAIRSDAEIESRRIESTRRYISENFEVVSDRFKSVRARPGIEEKRLEALRASALDPEVKKRRSEALRRAAESKEFRDKVSANSLAMWQGPEHAKKVSASFEERRRSGKLSKHYIYENKSGTFSVKIRHEGKDVNLGTFKCYDDAVSARDLFLEGVGR